MGPAVSWEYEIGIIPDLLTSPTVGFIPTIPLTDAGQLIDPLVSVPIDIFKTPEETATAEPELEPHGLLFFPCVLKVCPPILDQPLIDLVDLKLAHSDKFVLP